jgi:uncharacterized repeat protein (TIGR03803 family)
VSSFGLARYAFSISAAAALLIGCGAGMPGSVAQGSRADGIAHHFPSTWSFQLLHSFGKRSDTDRDHGGANPLGGLIAEDGTLYGTTQNGGDGDNGIVYSISTTGTKKVLFRFNFNDGALPSGDLAIVNGTLYGTTEGGGQCGAGVDYSLTTTGVEKVLHHFCLSGPASNPIGLVNLNGTLYGTTNVSAAGAVYRLSTSGAYKVLHAFRGGSGDGWAPDGTLVDVNGTLYGATLHGGTGKKGLCYSNGGCGTVFSITPAGKEKLVYSFQNGSDGWLPVSGLIYVNGKLYGTTYYGGGSGCGSTYGGCGTVYSVTTSGKETVLYRFSGGADGGNPATSLTEMNGTLYGTTSQGGSAGDGTVFSISTTGSEQVLHTFSGSDGAHPQTELTNLNSTLYGTTYRGGSRSRKYGTVFALAP